MNLLIRKKPPSFLNIYIYDPDVWNKLKSIPYWILLTKEKHSSFLNSFIYEPDVQNSEERLLSTSFTHLIFPVKFHPLGKMTYLEENCSFGMFFLSPSEEEEILLDVTREKHWKTLPTQCSHLRTLLESVKHFASSDSRCPGAARRDWVHTGSPALELTSTQNQVITRNLNQFSDIWKRKSPLIFVL